MIKLYRVFFAFVLIFLSTVNIVFAGEEFKTSFSATYNISTTGEATVVQDIKLTNRISNVYATQYALEIGSSRIEDVQAFTHTGKAIDHKITTTENKTIIVTNFDNKVVGKGQTLEFKVRYKNLDVTQKTGKVLEINIPKISAESDIEEYNVTINVPLVFGQPKTITPSTFKQTQIGNNTVLTFDSNQVKETGIIAIFGSEQIFNFNLTYNLENPTVSNAVTQVALPPDTSYQKVFYDSIEPNPEEIELDEDGNWIATFKLEPKQRVSVIAQGRAVIYMEPLVSIPDLSIKKDSYLVSQKYWDLNAQKVKDLAKQLNTPQKIYDYLVENFSYNYDRIDSGIGRLGVIDALDNPQNAICTEFTDSFIAISRAAGIPARELNGYAHTENSILKPLSLVQDVLHSWPEYYDKDEKLWKPVDPTWGNTTGGIDYFTHLDFNHFVFAIHGSSSTTPYPAGYYKFENQDSKDLDINFGSEVPTSNTKFNVVFEENTLNPFSQESHIKISIKNLSNIALYDLDLNTSAKQGIILNQSQEKFVSLLPFETKQIDVKLKPTGENPSIILNIADQTYESSIEKTINWKKISIIAAILALGSGAILIAIKGGSLLVSKSKQ